MNKFFKLFLGFISVVLLTSCTAGVKGNTADLKPASAAPSASALNEDGYPMQLTDASGFKFTLDKKPEKIVSQTLGTDEMLFSLVDKSRILAITKLSEQPISNISDEAKSFPVKIDSNLEMIISLKPDIVFVADWADKAFAKQLRDAKINVYAYKTPVDIDQQKNTLMEIASIVGEKSKGEELLR